MGQINAAHAINGVGRNVYNVRNGQPIPRSQVRHIIHGIASDNLMNAGIDPDDEPAERLLQSLQKKKASYCSLNEVKEDKETKLVNEVHATSGSLATADVELDGEEFKQMAEFSTSHRDEYGIGNEDDLFLAVAWVIPEEKRLFHQFTDVIHIDGTMKTNNEGRPLVTVTGRDSSGNQFAILRAFLPNERAWSFRWLFQNAMPSLLGPEFMARIRIIVTDGDSQETSQVDNAIAKFRDQIDEAVAANFPLTQRVRCGWHAIEKGWDRIGLNTVTRWKGVSASNLCHS